MADRQHFLLDTDAQQERERINNCPARSLLALARLRVDERHEGKGLGAALLLVLAGTPWGASMT